MTMTENGLNIQIISTKRTDFQADRVLLLGQVTEKKGEKTPLTFFKVSFSQPHIGTFGFALTLIANASQNKKSQYPATRKLQF